MVARRCSVAAFVIVLFTFSRIVNWSVAFESPLQKSTRVVPPKANALKSAPHSKPDGRKPVTIAHQILDLEVPLGTVMPAMYDTVNDIISEVRARIGNRPTNADREELRAFATATLELIDEVLIEKNFVYPPHDSLTLTLSDSLTPTKLEGELLTRIEGERANRRRLQHIAEHKDEHFYLSDCDTASFLYLAVGEALDLPLFLVEAPHHNFVRWYYTASEYDNWETMHGTTRTDQEYIDQFNISPRSRENGAYLSKMPRETTLGYCRCLVGMGFDKQKNCKDAQAAYRSGITTYCLGSLGWNNLAWSLVTCRNPACRNGREAVKLASKSVEIDDDPNNRDTLACAYAEAGDFAKAIEVEERVVKDRPSEGEFRKNLEGFRMKRTWIESHP